jgi:hypothetical protein
VDDLIISLTHEVTRQYSRMILDRKISFDRAKKRLHFATGLEDAIIEEMLIEEVRHQCPLRGAAA